MSENMSGIIVMMAPTQQQIYLLVFLLLFVNVPIAKLSLQLQYLELKHQNMKCNSCGKEGDDGENKLMQCSLCASVKYCSTTCQKSDWTKHKKNCTKAACLKLFAAIQDNDVATVTRLAKTKRVLNGRVDYTPPPDEGFPNPHEMGRWTGLHQCVRLQNVDMMKILIENGANVEVKDVDKETPLFLVSSSSAPEVMKVLLDAGADPNNRAGDGWTCLMVAVRQGDYESSKLLLGAGADMYLGRDMFGRGVIEINQMHMTGQGIRMPKGESYDAAMARYRRVESLLREWSI